MKAVHPFLTREVERAKKEVREGMAFKWKGRDAKGEEIVAVRDVLEVMAGKGWAVSAGGGY